MNHKIVDRIAIWGVAAMLTTVGLIPTALAGSAVADETSDSVESSTAVVAPNSFDASAEAVNEGARLTVDENDALDKRVLAYWTSERLAMAEAYGDGGDSQAPGPQEASGSTSSTDPAGAIDPIAPSDSNAGAPAIPTGMLFFERDGKDSYCSAAVVNTPSKRVIITAGHCIYESRAKSPWAHNAVFIPGYDPSSEDPTPAGVWTARSLRTFDDWMTGAGDYAHDVGFATLDDGGDAKQPIAMVVGAHGLAWGGSHEFRTSIIGYPGNLAEPGGDIVKHVCDDGVTRHGPLLTVDGCNFGQGASGGPWLHAYDEVTGLGRVRSVTSLWHPVTGVNWGPYFTADVKTMMDATSAD